MSKFKWITALIAVSTLTACGSTGRVEIQQDGGIDRPAASSVDVGVDWKWRVHGDTAVRPVQVFTLRGTTYLQMGITRPNIVVLVNGEVAPFRHAPPYLLIQGEPNQIDLVIDGYRAIVERVVPPVKESPLPPPPQGSDRIERILVP